jgi:hypothetical protein
VPFRLPSTDLLGTALALAEAKGYEVRSVRLTVNHHGRRTTVSLWLSPAPTQQARAKAAYTGQDVGHTPRRNLENLVAFVEGLPDVRQADGDLDATGGDAGVHEYPT